MSYLAGRPYARPAQTRVGRRLLDRIFCAAVGIDVARPRRRIRAFAPRTPSSGSTPRRRRVRLNRVRSRRDVSMARGACGSRHERRSSTPSPRPSGFPAATYERASPTRPAASLGEFAVDRVAPEDDVLTFKKEGQQFVRAAGRPGAQPTSRLEPIARPTPCGKTRRRIRQSALEWQGDLIRARGETALDFHRDTLEVRTEWGEGFAAKRRAQRRAPAASNRKPAHRAAAPRSKAG